MTARVLLAALLALLPQSRPYAACVAARAERIATDADAAAAATGVPAALLLAVGYMESHLGCAPGSGGCWGAPIDRAHRLTAGRAIHAARSLAAGRARCGSWRGAVGHFRCGRCACVGREGYVRAALRLAEGAERGAGGRR